MEGIEKRLRERDLGRLQSLKQLMHAGFGCVGRIEKDGAGYAFAPASETLQGDFQPAGRHKGGKHGGKRGLEHAIAGPLRGMSVRGEQVVSEGGEEFRGRESVTRSGRDGDGACGRGPQAEEQAGAHGRRRRQAGFAVGSAGAGGTRRAHGMKVKPRGASSAENRCLSGIEVVYMACESATAFPPLKVSLRRTGRSACDVL